MVSGTVKHLNGAKVVWKFKITKCLLWIQHNLCFVIFLESQVNFNNTIETGKNVNYDVLLWSFGSVLCDGNRVTPEGIYKE